VVIASGAVRQDGTSREYAPTEFPAVPDLYTTAAMYGAAKALGYTAHVGVVQSKDSFYGQHSPTRMPTASALLEKWEAWKRLGVLASEMEASTLFTVGASRGLRTGAVFHVIWNQERAEAGLDTDAQEDHDTEGAIRLAVDAIRILAAHDQRMER
jgi:uridine phosphorylase